MKKLFILLLFSLMLTSLAAQNPELVLQVGHMGDVNTISFSPGGNYILTASEDKTAKIWDVKSGKLFRTLNGHSRRVFSAMFSPDGKSVGTISEDKTAKIWDVETGQIINSIEGKIDFDKAFPVFSPDMKNIVMFSDSNKVDSELDDSSFASYIRVVDIRDVQNGKIIRSIAGHINDFVTVSFNPDGKFLVTMAADGTARIWNVASGEIVRTLPGATESDLIPTTIFSPDGGKLLKIVSGRIIEVWDFFTGKPVCKMKRHADDVIAASFSPDGKTIASLSVDNSLLIWDAGTGKLIKNIILKEEGFSSVSFTPNGKNLFICSGIYGYSIIQDIQTEKIVCTINGGSPFAFSPDGKSLVTTSNIPLVLGSSIQDGVPKIWDIRNGRLLHRLKGATSWVSLASFNPDGQNLITNSWDWTAKVWDLKYGKIKHNLAGHGQNVESIQYSSDGSKVLTTSNDKTAKVWDTGSGKLLFTVKGRRMKNYNPDPFTFVFFSPDSRRVAAAMTYSDTVSLYDSETGEIMHDIKAPGTVVDAKFSPDGAKLVLESKGANATCWDVQNGNLLYNLEIYDTTSFIGETKVRPAIFSPDGINIMTFPSEKIAEIWNAAAGELLFTIDSVHKIPEAPFSPDGKYVAIIRNKNTEFDPWFVLGIYDVPSGRLIRSMDYCLRCDMLRMPRIFSFDSKTIIIPGIDDTFQLWDFQNGEILRSFKADSYMMFNLDEVHLSPGDDKLFFKNIQGEIEIFDIGTGAALKSMNVQNKSFYLPETFSRDGNRFLTFTDDGDAEVWDAQSLEKLQKLDLKFGKTDDPLSFSMPLTFSYDGKRILTTATNGTTVIWDVQSGKSLGSLPQPDNSWVSGPLSPDGMMVVSKYYGERVKIWDIERQIWLPEMKISANYVNDIQFFPDSKKLLVRADSTMKLFDPQTGNLLLTIEELTYGSNPVTFSPDGMKIMSTTSEGSTKIWHAQDGKLLYRLDTVPMTDKNNALSVSGPIAFSPDGKKIIIVPDIWDAANGRLLNHLAIDQFYLLETPFSPDSKKMVINLADESENIRVKVWNVSDGKILQDLSWSAGIRNSYLKVKNIRFSPDRKRMVTIDANDIKLNVWDVKAGELINSYSSATGRTLYADFSSDGKSIIAWMNDLTIKTMDVQSWKITESKEWPETFLKPFFTSVICSYDGKMLASFSNEGDVGIWDIQNRRFLQKLEGQLKYVAWHSFTPDGKRLIGAASQNDTVRIWDVRSGKLLYILDAGEEVPDEYSMGIGSLLLSPDGRKIIASTSNIIKIWDAESAELLHKLYGQSGMTFLTDLSVSVSPDSRMIISTSYDSDTAKIWDIRSGKLLFCLDVIKEEKKPDKDVTESDFNQPQGIRVALFSSDSKKIKTVTTDGFTRIWDAKNGKLLESNKDQDQNDRPSGIDNISSPDNMRIVSFLWNGTALSWELIDGQWTLMRSLEGSLSPVISATFHPDNKQLFIACADSSARIWDVQNGEISMSFEKQHGYITSSGYSPDGLNLVTFISDSTAKIWDVQKGILMNTVEGKVEQVGPVTFSSDSRKLLVVNSPDNSAKIWEMGTGKLLFKIEEIFNERGEYELGTVGEVTFTPDGMNIVSASMKQPEPQKMSAGIWDVESGESLHTLDGSIVNSKSNIKAPFSPDGKKLVTASEEGIAKIWNVRTGKLFHILNPMDGIRKITATAFSPDGKSLLVSSYKYKAKDGLINEYPVEIWDPENGKMLRTIDFKSAPLKDISWAESRLIYSFNTALSLYNLQSGKEIVSFVSINKDDYVFILPSGEYSGTPEGIKNLTWRLGDRLYNFDQWDLQYNRPDKVLEQLGNTDTTLIRMYRKAYQKRLKRAGFTEEMFTSEWHTPGMKILNYDEMSYNTDKSQLKLEICGTDSKYKLDRFNVWVNDIPLYGAKGISLIKENTDSVNKIIIVPLSDGANEINVSCMNEKGVESLKESVNIIYHPETIVKPNLYIIAMSVSKYRDPQYNLQYAAKDGRDIASMFSSLATPEGDYGQVIVDTLFNERATRENFFNLKQKLSATNVNDQVLVFVSGHGLLNKDLDFYFATVDMDFNHPEKRGISFDDLDALLDSIPARKKLMMMDACHSGELDKEEPTNLLAQNPGTSSDITFRGNVKEYSFKGVNSTMSQSGTNLNSSFELMQELFAGLDKGTGTTVISAAAGKGYALESPQWNNGIFTFTILNGMKNKAADKNNDGQITVSELKDYSIKQVELLTGGKQKPTARRESINYDWKIW
jgi:WD40 repeat protein